jgi:hypothetical protein
MTLSELDVASARIYHNGRAEILHVTEAAVTLVVSPD